MGQLAFPWEINRDSTRAAVEARLESARIFKQIGFVRREMKMTTSPEPRYHGNTNAAGKPAEDIAVWNVSVEDRMNEDYDMVVKAVERLGKLERQVIELRYLNNEETFDYNVYSELHLSERKYYRIKSSAIYKLAFALRLERYIESDGA